MTTTQTARGGAPSTEFDPTVAQELVEKVGRIKAEIEGAQERLVQAQTEATEYLQRNGGSFVFTDSTGLEWEASRRSNQRVTWKAETELWERLRDSHPDLFTHRVNGKELEKRAKNNPKILELFAGYFTISETRAWVDVKLVKKEAADA